MAGFVRRALVGGGLRGLARATPWMESELVGVGRTLVDNALDTSESVDPHAQIEEEVIYPAVKLR